MTEREAQLIMEYVDARVKWERHRGTETGIQVSTSMTNAAQVALSRLEAAERAIKNVVEQEASL